MERRWLKAVDVDRRTPPKQGEEPTPAEVVTDVFTIFLQCRKNKENKNKEKTLE